VLPIPSVVPEPQRVTVPTGDDVRPAGAVVRGPGHAGSGPLVERIGSWASATIDG
jgi:hypothetical protein